MYVVVLNAAVVPTPSQTNKMHGYDVVYRQGSFPLGSVPGSGDGCDGLSRMAWGRNFGTRHDHVANEQLTDERPGWYAIPQDCDTGARWEA